ncbi:hypothetical protein [Legionella worsleiensis]|uniref:Uncharacterized protein n=1 Tax=Legionella worsleiensis TaxID=45076 RepID=A0A0W1ALS2_9GAMM|nr:hypothetical protein [Legionella worsleiensis]KTD82152.1 hypothetical protein Lwor_0072 [Legionella worsleiensis]STY31369.1 Uncharacterised protein [Legionella worsleiensis]
MSDNVKQDRKLLLSLVQNNGTDVLHDDDETLRPFLNSYLKFRTFKDTLEGKIKESADKLLDQVESFFLENNPGQPNLNQLQRVLDKTYDFLQHPSNDANVNDYSAFLQSALKSKSSGMQLLGKLMMALAIVVAGVSIALGLTGVGTIPAVSVGLAAAGLFAVGATLTTRQSEEDKENKELIQHFKSKL